MPREWLEKQSQLRELLQVLEIEITGDEIIAHLVDGRTIKDISVEGMLGGSLARRFLVPLVFRIQCVVDAACRGESALQGGAAQEAPEILADVASGYQGSPAEYPGTAGIRFPIVGPRGEFGAALAVKDRRLLEAMVTLREQTGQLPSPTFAGAVNTRHFPELIAGRHDRPAVHELVQLKSRDVHISPIWKGDAEFRVFDHPHLELPDLRPTRVLAGYRFCCALTVDDLELLRDLRED